MLLISDNQRVGLVTSSNIAFRGSFSVSRNREVEPVTVTVQNRCGKGIVDILLNVADVDDVWRPIKT